PQHDIHDLESDAPGRDAQGQPRDPRLREPARRMGRRRTVRVRAQSVGRPERARSAGPEGDVMLGLPPRPTGLGTGVATAPSRALTVRVTGGLVHGARGDGIEFWRGIPYAAAPVGSLRFRAPQPVIPWPGI